MEEQAAKVMQPPATGLGADGQGLKTSSSMSSAISLSLGGSVPMSA